MFCDDISVQPVCHLRAVCGASQRVEFVRGKRLGLDDERGDELRFDVAGVPEIEREFVISLESAAASVGAWQMKRSESSYSRRRRKKK
jgi:hypothetical protein